MAPRVLIFVVAYNAERTIQSVLQRIPESLSQYHTEILIIDDSSKDQTFQQAREMAYYPLSLDRPLQPRQPGLRRQPEDRLSLRHRKRLRRRRARPRRWAIRAGEAARSPPAAPLRRSRRRLRLPHDRSAGTHCAAACRSTNTSGTRSSPPFRTASSTPTSPNFIPDTASTRWKR